jgi:uncharacterized protein (TIGR02271 family)
MFKEKSLMSDKTLVALYDDASDARTVVSELSAADIDKGRSQVIDGDSLYGSSTSAAGLTGTSPGTNAGIGSDSGTGDILNRLTRAGVPDTDAHIYAEGVRRGGTLVIARVDDSDVDRGLDIMSRYRPVDIEQRGSSWRSAGWTSFDASAARYTTDEINEERTRYGRTQSDRDTGLGTAAAAMRDVGETNRTTRTGSDTEEVIPVTEEQLHVGKRAVERGGVRVHTRIVETPVEEQVRLRDETVQVERRVVDRPVSDVGNAFQERSIEVRETDEEAVVAKTARVTEEVVVRKDVEERAQTVSDTVRRTEVEVEDNRSGKRVERATDIDRTSDIDRASDINRTSDVDRASDIDRTDPNRKI